MQWQVLPESYLKINILGWLVYETDWLINQKTEVISKSFFDWLFLK